MLKWLRKKLKNWLLEDDDEILSFQIVVSMNGKIERVSAVNAIGLYLMCQLQDGSQRMVNETSALDPKHFRKLWEYFTQGKKLTWSDGTSYLYIACVSNLIL